MTDDGVQLITYPDRLAGDLPGLADLLDGPLRGVFRGVHVLPFYAHIDGADAGFDPTDHREVDPRVGSWADVRRLAGIVDVCSDLIVNHISVDSPMARDVLERGAESPYTGMLLDYGAVFPDGAREEDLLAIYRPRPGLPLSPTVVAGSRRLLWTTFTSAQLDLDLDSPSTWEYLREVLQLLARNGVRTVRLDAVGYVAKTPGTSCFITEDTLQVVDRLNEEAHRLGLRTLAEVHAWHQAVLRMAGRVDHVYDFALPTLLLHALHTGAVDPLLAWLDMRPANSISVLDTHDGIGVIDVGPDPTDPDSSGLLGREETDGLVEAIHRASGGVSRRATGLAAGNLDIYQVNCTWYDAVGHDDARMCLSRMVQLLTPGLAQVYYVGLLAGRGDLDRLDRTGSGREVNRHVYTPAEIDAALRTPVVRATLFLIRLRQEHPAFAGTPGHGPGEQPGSLHLRWTDGGHRVELEAIPGQASFVLTWTTPQGVRRAGSVADLAASSVTEFAVGSVDPAPVGPVSVDPVPVGLVPADPVE